MHIPYTSRVLYHLVGSKTPADDGRNFETLRSVLRSMEIRTSTVAGYSGGATFSIDPNRGCVDGEPIAQTVTCFCDIPFTSLGLHSSKYGLFGVGVDREIVAKWGGRPVIYVPVINDNLGGLNNYLCQEALNAWNGIREHFPLPDVDRSRVVGSKPESASDSANLAKNFIAKDVLAFVKTFDPTLPDQHPLNYYMEREWRKVAKLDLHLPLREIVAPASYHARLKEEFAILAALPFRAVGEVVD